MGKRGHVWLQRFPRKSCSTFANALTSRFLLKFFFFLQSNRATERKLDPDAALRKNITSPKALQMFTSCPLKVFAPKPDGILNVRFLWRFKVERDLL